MIEELLKKLFESARVLQINRTTDSVMVLYWDNDLVHVRAISIITAYKSPIEALLEALRMVDEDLKTLYYKES